MNSLPNSVPSSFNFISPPPASILISPAESIVKSPVLVIDELSRVMLSTVNEPKVPTDVTLGCAAVCNVPASSVAVTLPVEGYNANGHPIPKQHYQLSRHQQ